jgi:hypothetical protein
MQHITIDGADLPIATNLDAALRRCGDARARTPPGVPTPIWADGICISQKDVPEHNQQVRLMRRIYSQYQTGLIWLGEEADGSDGIPAFLMNLSRAIPSDPRSVREYHDNPVTARRERPGLAGSRYTGGPSSCACG